MDFPITPEFWWSTDILSSSNFLQGVDQKILPCGQGRIDSVKINPSLLMMRECSMLECITRCWYKPLITMVWHESPRRHRWCIDLELGNEAMWGGEYGMYGNRDVVAGENAWHRYTASLTFRHSIDRPWLPRSVYAAPRIGELWHWQESKGGLRGWNANRMSRPGCWWAWFRNNRGD